ncbi:MAG TPA: VWA domain-containing protein, partial [bacterium]|nr:VWA domain-containing protein [bacterium]
MKIIKKVKRKITNKVRRSGKYFSIQIALVSMLLNMFSPFLLSYSYVVYAEDIVAPATEEIASEEPSIDESKSEEPSSEEESTDTEEVSSQETSSTQETTAEGDQNSDPVVKETVTQETEVQENALNENIETIDTEPETINEPEPVVEEISVEYPVVAEEPIEEVGTEEVVIEENLTEQPTSEPSAEISTEPEIINEPEPAVEGISVEDPVVAEEPIEEVGTEETVVTEENAIEPSTSEPSVEISTEPASSEPEGDILPDGISDYRPEPEITPAVTDTDEVADPVAEAVEQKTGIIEQVCLSEGTEIINSTNDDWNIDSENGYAETKDPVKLGVKYIFPEEKDVTLTFKCLPVNEEDRSILKIQKVKVEDLNLPDEFKTDAEYAYDITTEMEDGSFEYDLTLPKPEGVEAEVSYVEKNIEEVISEKISSEDIISVEEENIDQEQNDKKVKISELDHFTIYIVRTSGHLPRLSSGTVNNQAQVTVLPNASITVTLEVTTNGANDVDDWRSSQYKIGNGSWECVDTTDHTGDGTYTDSFEINAPSDVGVYDLSLNVYNGSGCTGGSDNPTSGVVPYVMSNAITVKAPVSNPPLSQACGLDIALVIDNSTSISSTEMTQIKNAMTAFVNALNGTPTWFSVTKFATTASVSQTFTGNLTSVKSAINAIPVGGGFTNWQDGLTKAQSTFDPRSTKPNLIIFASDGNPNRTGPTGTSVDESVAVANAVVVADSIKTGGTRILALGVGADLDTANMIAISGTEVDTGDVLTSDVITSDFNQLAADLAEFASQTCGGTITINKYIDIISDSNLADDAWSFTTNVSGYESVQTSEGSVNIPVPIGSGYSVTESSVIPGFTFGSASCQKNDGSSVGTPGGFGVTGIAMGADDIISCNFLNTTNKGSITIEKDAVPNDPQDFSFTATGLTPSTFSLDDDSDVTLSNTRTFNNLTPGGTYAVSETGVTGWELTGASCSDGSPVSAISLQPGENITCTFTNTRQKGTLTVIKDVNNDEDGTASASDFQLYVKKGGVDVVGSPFSGSETGTVFQLDPGAYVISEDSDSNYISSISGNCASDGSVTISAGDNKTCTITNDDKDFLPSIEVTKTAGVSSINEPGG